jgi:hypothetical protein
MVIDERAVHEPKFKVIPEATVVGKLISCRFEQPENDNEVKLLIEVVGKLILVNP